MNLTIDGSALANGITIDGNDAGRVIEVAEGVTNVLIRETITGGTAPGILNFGNLRLFDCTIAANQSAGDGMAFTVPMPFLR